MSLTFRALIYWRVTAVAAMLKTTKRFIGEARYVRLAKVFHCANFAPNQGCLYNTPSGGANDAVLWPGDKSWSADDGNIFTDLDLDHMDEETLANLPEL